MIIDTHCHLASKQFIDDLEEVIKRAESDKISKLISIGTDLEDSKECVRIANIHDSVYATVGIHPCSVTDISEENWLQIISDLANANKVVAVGEIGLDYFHPAPSGWNEESYRKRQKDFFISQLELAVDLLSLIHI